MSKKAQIADLLNEAKVLQQWAVDASCKKDDDVVRHFTSLIFQGRLRDALQLLSLKPSGGSLSPDLVLPDWDNKTVFVELCSKLPKGSDFNPSAVVSKSEGKSLSTLLSLTHWMGL